MCEELDEFKKVVSSLSGCDKNVQAANKQQLVKTLKTTMKRMQNEIVDEIKNDSDESWDYSHIEALIWLWAGGKDPKSNAFKEALKELVQGKRSNVDKGQFIVKTE